MTRPTEHVKAGAGAMESGRWLAGFPQTLMFNVGKQEPPDTESQNGKRPVTAGRFVFENRWPARSRTGQRERSRTWPS